MITEDKVIELFCMADAFCKFFDRMVAKYTFKSTVKRSYHRNSIMSKVESCLSLYIVVSQRNHASMWKEH